MFPQSDNIQAESATADSPKISFLFDFKSGDFVLSDGKPVQCTGETALQMWIEKAIRTEKHRFKIYEDTDYGVTVEDLLIGHNYPESFIASELKREIEEALLKNPQITAVSSVEIKRDGTVANIALTVETADGNSMTQEVITFG